MKTKLNPNYQENLCSWLPCTRCDAETRLARPRPTGAAPGRQLGRLRTAPRGGEAQRLRSPSPALEPVRKRTCPRVKSLVPKRARPGRRGPNSPGPFGALCAKLPVCRHTRYLQRSPSVIASLLEADLENPHVPRHGWFACHLHFPSEHVCCPKDTPAADSWAQCVTISSHGCVWRRLAHELGGRWGSRANQLANGFLLPGQKGQKRQREVKALLSGVEGP